MQKYLTLLIGFAILLSTFWLGAQPVTGVWRGKMQKGLLIYKVEVKFISTGDSITGTSYYYNNARNYQRYTISGYTDANDGSIHWWDKKLIDEQGKLMAIPGARPPFAAAANLNCPGGGVMMFDGEEEENDLAISLNKTDDAVFKDEWNEVIENWYTGGNNSDDIARIGSSIPKKEPLPVEQPKIAYTPRPVNTPAPAKLPEETTERAINSPAHPQKSLPPPPPLTITEKMQRRGNITQTTLPLAGDSIEIHFYDNAEIDGDSISLFLNNKLVFEHVRLSAEPFIVKFATAELPADAELSMVAENLGSIPPNTSFMLAYVNGQRYTARLESTENTNAIIRFTKP